jgi:hypothetical protein
MRHPDQGSFYDLLGVRSDATAAQIRSAFLRLAQQWHPDLNRDVHNADRRFKQIRRVYEILSDPLRRAAYDEDPSRFQLGDAGMLVDNPDPIVTRPDPTVSWSCSAETGGLRRHRSFRPQWIPEPRWHRESLFLFLGCAVTVIALSAIPIYLLRAHQHALRTSRLAQQPLAAGHPSVGHDEVQVPVVPLKRAPQVDRRPTPLENVLSSVASLRSNEPDAKVDAQPAADTSDHEATLAVIDRSLPPSIDPIAWTAGNWSEGDLADEPAPDPNYLPRLPTEWAEEVASNWQSDPLIQAQLKSESNPPMLDDMAFADPYPSAPLALPAPVTLDSAHVTRSPTMDPAYDPSQQADPPLRSLLRVARPVAALRAPSGLPPTAAGMTAGVVGNVPGPPPLPPPLPSGILPDSAPLAGPEPPISAVDPRISVGTRFEAPGYSRVRAWEWSQPQFPTGFDSTPRQSLTSASVPIRAVNPAGPFGHSIAEPLPMRPPVPRLSQPDVGGMQPTWSPIPKPLIP